MNFSNKAVRLLYWSVTGFMGVVGLGMILIEMGVI